MERQDPAAADSGAAARRKRNDRVLAWLDEDDSPPRNGPVTRSGRHAAESSPESAAVGWTFTGGDRNRPGRHAAATDPPPGPLGVHPMAGAPEPPWWEPVPAGPDAAPTRATVRAGRMILTVGVLAAISMLALLVAAVL
jgi:hypothetical protein